MESQPPKRSKPIEQVSLSIPFFVTALAFFLCSVWAVVDEYGARRVWKHYQSEFARIEADKIRAEIEREMKRLEGEGIAESEGGEDKLPPLPDIREKLAQAREAVNGGQLDEINDNLRKKEREIFLATQEWKIAKSYDVEHAYFYEEALKHGGETEIRHYKEALEKDAADIAHWGEIVEGLKAEKLALEGEKEGLLTEVEKWEEMEKTATRELAVLQDKLARVTKPGFIPAAVWYDGTIQQIVLRGYQHNNFEENQYTVDRCMTCHMGADKAGFEEKDLSVVYRTHPDREHLLGTHPVRKFACITCHQGQGTAVSTTTAAHDDLDEAHGLIHYWEEPVLGYVQKGEYHEYREERDTRYTQASCFKCHAQQYEIESPHADWLNAGREYVTKLGCWGCHNIKNVGDNAVGVTGKKVAPSLERIAYKVDPSWIVSWLETPQAHLPRSRMPEYPDFGNPKDSPEYRKDLESLTAFLVSRSKRDWETFDGDRRSESYFRSGSAKRGEGLFNSVGCRGCHAMGDRPENYGEDDNPFYKNYDAAPDLYNTGNKVKSAKWLFHWIKNPQSYDPNSAMPSLRLSDQEALDIVAFLIDQKGKDIPPETDSLKAALQEEGAIKHGEWIVQTYGCFGCHNIRGMENEGKISVELSAFGAKQPYELSFGTRTDIPETWEDWTKEKLENPRGFQTERQQLKMPNFHLPDDAADAIRIFLKSQTGHEVGTDWFRHLDTQARALEEGRALVEQYNCKGCHMIDNVGGRIYAYYDNPGRWAPPRLNDQGNRTQPDWLFNFLLEVKPVRTWLDIRMPTFPFTEEEAQKIVRYFQARGGDMNPFDHVDIRELDPESVAQGRKLFQETYRCTLCHFEAAGYTEAQRNQMGPNLRQAHQRLDPDWIVKWVANPGKIMPGVGMPAFFYLEEDAHGNLIMDPANQYAASALPQLEALRDYILVYGREREVQNQLGTRKPRRYSQR